MTGAHVLAIDQGTTNTKVALLDSQGVIVAQAQRPVPVSHPQPGWAEQDPEAIWASVRDAIVACLASAGGVVPQALGISNQRESVVLWDRRTGQAIGPCIIWQCARTAPRLDQLRRAGHAEAVSRLTGLTLDPMFPAAKIAWLLDHAPDGRAGARDHAAGTIDSWLLWKLTDGAVHACDSSNASRTQLFDIGRQRWDETLAGIFDVPLSVLPEVHPSDALFGKVTAIPELSGVPIHAMLGDSHAALFGHGVRTPGAVKATYGTGSSLMTLTERPLASRHGLSTTIAWNRGGVVSYALEGNIIVSGQALAFTAQLLGLPGPAALADLAATVPDSAGVCFVPALSGLGAPHWDAAARGLFCGLSLSTMPAHLARAALEAVALQVADVFRGMESDLSAPLHGLSADEMKQALRVGASSGKMPDSWWNWGGSLASPYNQAGLVVEITPEMMAKNKLNEFLIPAGVELHKDAGKLYGIPHRIGPFSFFYKKELFDKYGLKPPTTLAELETIADTLKKNNVIPFSNGGKFSWMTMRYFDFFLETFAGPEGHDALLDMKTSWKSEPVVKSFAKLKEWSDKGYFNPGFLNVDPATSVTMLYNNSAAMVFESVTTETNRLVREGQDPAAYGTFPIPTGNKVRRVAGSPSQIQVSSKTSKEKQDAALLWAIYVARPDVAPFTNANVGFPSATKGVFPTGNVPSSRQWAEWVQNDIGLYRLTDQGLPQNIVASYFEAQDSMLLGMMTPAEAAAEVQKAIEKNAKKN